MGGGWHTGLHSSLCVNSKRRQFVHDNRQCFTVVRGDYSPQFTVLVYLIVGKTSGMGAIPGRGAVIRGGCLGWGGVCKAITCDPLCFQCQGYVMPFVN